MADADDLRKFKCATTLLYEQDVERFIQGYALSLMRNASVRERKLHGAWHKHDELVGVVMHEAETRFDADATYIRLIAVSQTWQSVVLDQGDRVTDRLMQTVRTYRVSQLVSADIHEENVRSLAVFERYVNVIFTGNRDDYGMCLRAGAWK
jgi:hypothetical protein